MNCIKTLPNRRTDETGFTLLEIIVAIVLITVALIGLASVTTTVINGNQFNKTLSLATTLAKDKMEELKSMPFASLPSAAATDYATGEGVTQAGSSGSLFTRTWTVTGSANLKTITVTVTWTPSRTVQLQTLRARD